MAEIYRIVIKLIYTVRRCKESCNSVFDYCTAEGPWIISCLTRSESSDVKLWRHVKEILFTELHHIPSSHSIQYESCQNVKDELNTHTHAPIPDNAAYCYSLLSLHRYVVPGSSYGTPWWEFLWNSLVVLITEKWASH